mgnify:CR=1 FL=1
MEYRAYFDPEIQTMPLERVHELQAERLGRQLDRVWNTPVPFFRRKLESAGLRRDDLVGLDALRLIPATLKDELRQSEAEHPPFGDYRGAPIDKCVRLGASTGTSGEPTLILWTRKDLDVDYQALLEIRVSRFEPDELAGLERVRDALDGELGATLRGLLRSVEVKATVRRADALLASGRFPLPSPTWPAVPWPPF